MTAAAAAAATASAVVVPVAGEEAVKSIGAHEVTLEIGLCVSSLRPLFSRNASPEDVLATHCVDVKKGTVLSSLVSCRLARS